MPDGFPYDWERDLEGVRWTVTVIGIFDHLGTAQDAARDLEDLINRLNGEFDSSTIEPA